MASVYTTARGKSKKSKVYKTNGTSTGAENKLKKNPIENFMFEDKKVQGRLTGGGGPSTNSAIMGRLQEKLLLKGSTSTSTEAATAAAIAALSGAAHVCTCGKPASSACARCKAQWYCSADCQKAHWKTHKPTCGTGGGESKANGTPAAAAATTPAPAAGSATASVTAPGGPVTDNATKA